MKVKRTSGRSGKLSRKSRQVRRSRCFTLSGDVGGRQEFFVAPGATRRLQIIAVTLPADSNLVIKRARFFFNDPEIWLRVSVLDLGANEIRFWLAPTSAGEVSPHVVVFSTTRRRTIYLAIAGTNIRTTGQSLFRPWDGWWVKFAIEPRRDV